MLNDKTINLGNILLSLSDSVDLTDNMIASHQQRVAYIAWQILKKYGMLENDLVNVFIAALLHDIGAVSLQERLSFHNFEEINPETHCARGELLLKRYPFFRQISQIIKHHHRKWEEWDRTSRNMTELSSQIIFLSDYIERLIDRKKYILDQKKDILDKINSLSGTFFNPVLVENFTYISGIESFWLDVTSPRIYSNLFLSGPLKNREIDFNDLEVISKLFRDIIDFKSPYTAAHTAGVSSSAGMIAQLLGMAEMDVHLIKIAGNFHDLGKLIIPNDILDKPDKLTDEEFDIIKSHSYHTFHIINSIKGLEEIAQWSAFHHERLDGSGYPFHMKSSDLSTYPRIIMVADVFTALSEDRPYRSGMKKDSIVSILKDISDKGHLDKKLVNLVIENFEEISEYVLGIENLIRGFYKTRFNIIHPELIEE